MSDGTKQLGAIGEAAAVEFLQRLGHTILARNYRCPVGELDVITFDRGTVVFVEVKSLASNAKADPESHITPSKQRKLRSVAEYWIAKHRRPDCAYRFDAVSVVVREDASPMVRHFPEAFIPRD